MSIKIFNKVKCFLGVHRFGHIEMPITFAYSGLEGKYLQCENCLKSVWKNLKYLKSHNH